jgi:hypothetical protein
MTPEMLKPGKPYPGALPDGDGAVFELSKAGPELRLFFASTPDELVQCVEREPVRIGVLRHGNLGIVPWKIGEQLQGDGQFHVHLYPPETRPTDRILSGSDRYAVQIVLVECASRTVRAVRSVLLSHELSVAFNEIVAYQLGNHLGHEEYDAQVSEYQSEFPDLETVVAAADRFEQAEDYTPT